MVGLINIFIFFYIIRLAITIIVFFSFEPYQMKETLNLQTKKEVIYFIFMPFYIPVWLVKLMIRKLNENFN